MPCFYYYSFCRTDKIRNNLSDAIIKYDAYGLIGQGFVQNNGRVVVNNIIVGPGGIAGMETVWEGNKLITITLFK